MSLPGRELPADTARLLGEGAGWRALSLDPEATIRASLTLIPGVAMFFAVLTCDLPARWWLLAVAVTAAMLSLALGLAQIAGGAGSGLYLYNSLHQGMPTGFFTNRNHQGALLALVPALAAALVIGFPVVSRRANRSKIGQVAITAALSTPAILGVLATGSRAAAMLLALSVASASLMLLVSTQTWVRRWQLGLLAAGLVIGLGLIYLLVHMSGGSAVGALAERGVIGEDQRFDFWPDVVFAIGQYFPVGSGIGTFEPVFNAAESLSIVGPHYVNHAHNDFLEIAVEAGAPGLALLFAFLAWGGWRTAHVWRIQAADAGVTMARAASVAIAMLVLHSIVDYPLRTLALSTLLGMFAAFLATPVVAVRRQAESAPLQPTILPNDV